MTFYLGNPGSITAIPHPMKGLTLPLDRQSATSRTIGGGQVVSFTPAPGRRTYQMAWSGLTTEQYSVLEEFFAGARGSGPFALLDPGRRNKLSANQSSASTVGTDTTGFAVSGGELLASTTDAYQRGPRSLRWTLPATVTSGVLDLAGPAGLTGWPAPSGQPWTFSGSVSSAGVAPSVTITPVLSWQRLDGSEVSTTAGTPVVAASGAWTAFSVSAAAPPAGAVSLRPQLRVTPGVLVTAGAAPSPIARPAASRSTARPVALGGRAQAVIVTSSPRAYGQPNPVTILRSATTDTAVLVDSLMLDQYATVRTWVLGTGVPRVSFTRLNQLYRTIPFTSCQATFVEVG